MNTLDLSNMLKGGKYDNALADIYSSEEAVEYQKNRYIHAVQMYKELYGEGDVSVFSAPGRSEVCGNHTDHQNGKVIATSVEPDVIAVVSKSGNSTATLVSEGFSPISVDIKDLSVKEIEKGSSAALLKGVLFALKQKGFEIGGFNAYTESNVIVGAGLSSSAAFENVIGTIISGLFNDMKIGAEQIAVASKFAENVYFGKPCGLMDQMASAVGGIINIDFYDPENPVVKKSEVDLGSAGYSLCIVDTKGSHVDLTAEYAAVPAEMCSVANYLGKKVLRECDEKEFYEKLPEIRGNLGDRAALRAIHFFEEEKNVENAVCAIENGRFGEFLSVIKKSGDSSFKYLQNVYVNSDIKHQNVSVALAVSESILKNHGVCRVHGGGFAGTIQAFVKNDFTKEYKNAMDSLLGKDSCHILKSRKYGCIKVV